MTMNKPIPLLTIAELWAMDPGIPSADYAKMELIRALWKGGFPDGTVSIETQQFFAIVAPPDHDLNLAGESPSMDLTRAYVVEILSDLAGNKLQQVLKEVRDGSTRVVWAESDNPAPEDPTDPATPSGSSKGARFTLIQEDPADPATLAGYPFNAYTRKQQSLLESLRVLPSTLADWCDRTGRRRPSFLSELGCAPPQPKASYMTGKPGRPSSSKLLLEELDRRGELGLVEDTLAKEARALKAWADTAHPDAPPTTIKTISATIRAAYLKDPLIYYFAMLGKHFGMKQVRIWLTFTLVKPPDLMGGVCASPCNLIVRDRLTY